MTDPAPLPQRSLRGLLEDAEGRPLAGARVAFVGGSGDVQTGPDGSFVVPEPPSGAPAAPPVPMAVVHVRGTESRLPVPALGGERVRLVLAPPDAIPVRVLTPGTAPVPARFGWMALRRRPDGGFDAGPAGEASAPRFAARGLAPGTWTVAVWAGPFLPAVAEGLTLDGRTCHPLVTLEVARRGASVAGRAFDPSGRPRVAALVRAVPADPALRAPPGRLVARTDGGGRYRLEGLLPGRYVLRVEPVDGASPFEVPVGLLEREERAQDLVG